VVICPTKPHSRPIKQDFIFSGRLNCTKFGQLIIGKIISRQGKAREGKGEGKGRGMERDGEGCVMAVGGMDAPA